MADSDPTTLALLNYYCRQNLYHHVQTVAQDAIKKYGHDPVLIFYRALGMLNEERIPEAMRELQQIKDREEVQLCSIMALIIAHKRSKNIDKEAIVELDAKLKEQRRSAGEKALYFAGLYLLHGSRNDKAREYIDRLLKINPQSREGLTLRGWIDLTSEKEQVAKKAIRFFEEADTQHDIEWLFGKAKYFELRQKYTVSLDLVNQIIALNITFVPALVEKMMLLLALKEWDQAFETSQRALAYDNHCLEAKRFQILHTLCREGNYTDAANRIVELIQDLDRIEPKNPALYINMAQSFSKVCGRNQLILQQTYTLCERAVAVGSNNCNYATELGYQLIMQGRYEDAMQCYRQAMQLDETSVPALIGVIRCQLNESMVDEASQQLEFLNELQQTIGKHGELYFLTALQAQKRNKNPDEVTKLLTTAIDLHFTNLQGLPLGVDYYIKLNPDLVLEIAKLYLVYAPQLPTQPGQTPSPLLQTCGSILEPIIKSVPGLLEAKYLLARVKYLAGESEPAQMTLQLCLDQDPSFSEAHLLMAQIYLQMTNYVQCQKSLELGLSYNFEVREMPLYHLVKARCHRRMGELDECVKTLQAAMSLPGVRRPGQPNKKSKVISTADRVSVFLDLADSLNAQNSQHEAAKIMQDAINEFSGTTEETRVMIANATLAVSRGDIELALSMLRSVTPEQAYYVEAREKMAYIYLHYRKDKRLFTSCYRELVDKQPSPHTCLLLGDAYMSIQEPEKAIEVYDAALKRNPKDSTLAIKIGEAMVKTHNYGRAISYYEAALKTTNQHFLRHHLGELLLKIHQYEKCEKVLRVTVDQDPGSDIQMLIDHTKCLIVLSKVQHNTGRIDEALNTLKTARDVQARVLKRCQTEQPDAVTAQKQLSAEIHVQMAQLAAEMRDLDNATRLYKDALVFNEGNSKVILELAKLYLMQDKLDACENQCHSLLNDKVYADEASMMLIDIMTRRNDIDKAVHHFQSLLDRKPDHFLGLSKYIELVRRSGKLETCPKYLEAAEKSSSRAAVDPGFHYCKGIYQWYTGVPNEALKQFNMARKDTDWGQKALRHMIELCLNPDNVTLGGEVLEGIDQDPIYSAEKQDTDKVAYATAEKLLKELKPSPGSYEYDILEGYVMIATKAKPNVERALNMFMDIASKSTNTDQEDISALLGMATAYMILKQTPKARNQLKRIAKMTWNSTDAEVFEKGWLLLADIYIQGGKYDLAEELLKKCLLQNKSCCKAYEYMGHIKEKEQSYKDAAQHYEQAWKFGNEASPQIGYKLAFNYMKGKRYLDAIDICHKVLEFQPNYPRIRKDILEKARASIRA